MSRIVVCMDCPSYQKGGYCYHKKKDVGALSPACDHAKNLNQKFNPEDETVAEHQELTMITPAPESTQTKTCSHCGETKPLADFYKDKKATDGHQSWCKRCVSLDNAARARKALAEKRAKTETKTCPKCGRELPREAFYPKLEAKDGLQSWCKECNAADKRKDKPGTPIVVRETLTDKQMVELLRQHGWEVTCKRVVTEEL